MRTVKWGCWNCGLNSDSCVVILTCCSKARCYCYVWSACHDLIVMSQHAELKGWKRWPIEGVLVAMARLEFMMTSHHIILVILSLVWLTAGIKAVRAEQIHKASSDKHHRHGKSKALPRTFLCYPSMRDSGPKRSSKHRIVRVLGNRDMQSFSAYWVDLILGMTVEKFVLESLFNSMFSGHIKLSSSREGFFRLVLSSSDIKNVVERDSFPLVIDMDRRTQVRVSWYLLRVIL